MIYEYKQTNQNPNKNGFVWSADDSGVDSLEHHGVAGQKWGVRNGPPYPVQSGKTVHYNLGKMTEKTKATYQKAKAAIKTRSEKRKAAKESQKANINELGPKKFVKSKQRISDMSSAELRARIERLKLEEEYRKYLNGGQTQQQNFAKGKGVVDTFMKAYGDSTFKKVADELVVGVAKIGVTAASSAVKNSIDRRNTHKKNLEDLKKKAFENDRDDAREARKKEEKREEDRYNDEREIWKEANKEYWKARAQDRGKYEADEERKRRQAARKAQSDIWNYTHYNSSRLYGG